MSYLWHNGIIKEGKYEGEWDTEWLHEKALEEDLSNVDGTFACLMFRGSRFFVFRNEISPLFIEGTTLSSTKFNEAEPVDANYFWHLDFTKSKLVTTRYSFDTKENPYYFGD